MPIRINSFYKCPFCKHKISIYEQICANASCGEDLSLLSEVKMLPYVLFNQGMEKLKQGDPWEALVKLCAAVEFGKNFIEGHEALARLAESLGLQELAVRHFENAQSSK